MNVHKLIGLFTLLLSSSHAIAENASTQQADDALTNSASNSIHFVVLPYLSAFHYDHNKTPNIIHHEKGQQDLSEYNWSIGVTSIPEFRSKHDQLQTLDTDLATGSKLAADHHNIHIPIPEKRSLLLPLHNTRRSTSPLWLHYTKSEQTTWHSPKLTPAIAARVIAAKKETDRIAVRMADRAFYFGYDTNEDALE